MGNKTLELDPSGKRKVSAAQTDECRNHLLEQAIQDLLKVI